MDVKKTPLLRLVTVNSDESTVVGATRTVALLNPDTGRYLTGVKATLKLLSPHDIEQLEKKHRTIPDRTSGRVEWKIDTKALLLDILSASLQSWEGVIGADSKPMPVCLAAFHALDDQNQLHLAGIAKTPAEMIDAEVVEASFRKPAPVAGVAG